MRRAHAARASDRGAGDNPLRHVVVTVADWIADPDGLFVADFDLLSRLPGLERIDIVVTEAVLGSGFHERVHDWWPGIDEQSSVGSHQSSVISHQSSGVRPVLVTPPGAQVDDVWWTHRDREEELVAIVRRLKADRRAGMRCRSIAPPSSSSGRCRTSTSRASCSERPVSAIALSTRCRSPPNRPPRSIDLVARRGGVRLHARFDPRAPPVAALPIQRRRRGAVARLDQRARSIPERGALSRRRGPARGAGGGRRRGCGAGADRGRRDRASAGAALRQAPASRQLRALVGWWQEHLRRSMISRVPRSSPASGGRARPSPRRCWRLPPCTSARRSRVDDRGSRARGAAVDRRADVRARRRLDGDRVSTCSTIRPPATATSTTSRSSA